MLQINYLAGSIYHMVHRDYLQSVFWRRALLSKEQASDEQVSYQAVVEEEGQNRRGRIFIHDLLEGKQRSLQSYVSCYFVTRNPILYAQLKRGNQEDIVFFEISRTLLADPEVLFTDGDATYQQLSKTAEETVEITPANSPQEVCTWRYQPYGPLGNNVQRANVYSDATCLELLNWNIIQGQWSNEEEKRRIKLAEVLVPDLLPLSRIEGIAVKSQRMMEMVNTLIVESGLTGRIPAAAIKPQFYFQ